MIRPKSQPLDELEAAARDLRARVENEAETRHKLIDLVLHNVLGWPRNRVKVEEFIQPGYADYVLQKSNDEPLLFIEAKRAGVFFTLPQSHKQDETHCYMSIQKLCSDDAIQKAMNQVRTYCIDTGCEFACVTNGHEWIFFKTFEKTKRWDALQAFVIRDIDFFRRDYTKCVNCLSYMAIVERSSLIGLLTSAPPKDRNIYYAKDRIESYGHPITANRLAATLRPVVNYYFGPISDTDHEFMDRCYVSQRDYQQALEGMRNVIQDSLSPYFEQYGVQQLEDTGRGGRLGGRLTKSVKHNRRGEVLVLFGGKGAGKSTFIKRLLHHQPPPWLQQHAVIAIIDLLKTPEDTAVIRTAIWDTLVQALDPNGLLGAERETMIRELFSDRYEIAARQDLAGIPKASEAYNTLLNGLVSSWKSDKPYCAKRLVNYWNQQGKGVIVVVDNTDQYSGANQDFCFTSAQEIANELGCVTLISMREERFYNSKIHGVLDAFQNAGFHISSPRPAEVFRKRLSYTTWLLDNKKRRETLVSAPDALVDDCVRYLKIVNREFSSANSPLTSFLTACAHGDTRLSLDLFRSFLLSGYTNVEEMLTAGSWNFQTHQVIKPVMVPNRYFYDEYLSDIPNIYQLRYGRHASHFTGLRVLRKLEKAVEGASAGYVSIAELKAYFAVTFNMLDDFIHNVDVLLKHGFVESNNRLDCYSDSVDSLKITSYGLYMFRELAYYFTYLDLICTDCGIFDESVSNYLLVAARREYALFIKHERVERVKLRLDRVEHFIEYLRQDEMRERELYSLGMPEPEMFTHKAFLSFQAEKARVLKSAGKQINKYSSGKASKR